MMLKITGKDNKTLKLVKALKKKNNREKERLFVAEGRKIVLESFGFVPDSIRFVVVSEPFLEKETEIVKRAESVCDKVFVVGDQTFDEISDTDTPQGILAVLDLPENEFCADEKSQDILVLDRVSEPGNLGTVIRTAEAFGFDGIYLMKGCVDIFSSKTVRSTMGSIFRMKFRTNCELADIENLRNAGFAVVTTTPSGDFALEKFSVPERTAVVIGNEAHGVCDEILGMSDFSVRISMNGMAESLNAAVAAGITMHWIKNCRGR